MKKCPLCGRIFVGDFDASCIDCGHDNGLKISHRAHFIQNDKMF